MSETKRSSARRSERKVEAPQVSTSLESLSTDSLVVPSDKVTSFNRLRADFWNTIRLRDPTIGYGKRLFDLFTAATEADIERVFNIYLLANILIDPRIVGCLSGINPTLRNILFGQLMEVADPIFQGDKEEYPGNRQFFVEMLTAPPQLDVLTHAQDIAAQKAREEAAGAEFAKLKFIGK